VSIGRIFADGAQVGHRRANCVLAAGSAGGVCNY